MTVDRDSLLAFLTERQQARGSHDTCGLVIWAVYGGLADRIRRGEFDEPKGENDADTTA